MQTQAGEQEEVGPESKEHHALLMPSMFEALLDMGTYEAGTRKTMQGWKARAVSETEKWRSVECNDWLR